MNKVNKVFGCFLPEETKPGRKKVVRNHALSK